MDEGEDKTGIRGFRCRRELSEPLSQFGDAVEFRMRFLGGKKYFLRLFDDLDRTVAECRVDSDGWIRFSRVDGSLDTGRYLTWFRGRPCVDPDFIPGTSLTRLEKGIETDEHLIRLSGFDFQKQALEFTFDEEPTVQIANGMLCVTRNIACVELSSDPSDPPGARIKLKSFRRLAGTRVEEEDGFPVHWEPVPPLAYAYPGDKVHEAVTRPVEGSWLECEGRFCRVRARLPGKIKEGELTFRMSANNIYRESCVELYESNGTVGEGMWPIKTGIIRETFFHGYAARQYSAVAKREAWRSRQMKLKSPLPEADQIYEFRMRWKENGSYRLWIDHHPVAFGVPFGVPFGVEMDSPSFDIPFTDPVVPQPFGGIDAVGLHYVGVRPDGGPYEAHRVRYSGFRLTSPVGWE